MTKETKEQLEIDRAYFEKKIGKIGNNYAGHDLNKKDCIVWMVSENSKRNYILFKKRSKNNIVDYSENYNNTIFTIRVLGLRDYQRHGAFIDKLPLVE